MKRVLAIGLLLFASFGCAMMGARREAPFRHSSVVAEWNLSALRDAVRQQEEARLHPSAPNVVTLKRYPNKRELERIEAALAPGDKIFEFKNDDWWSGYDAASKEAERAFCVMRSDVVVKSVSIWSTDD